MCCLFFVTNQVSAQTSNAAGTETIDNEVKEVEGESADQGSTFWVEKVRVDGGAEILTIFARSGNAKASANNKDAEIPLVSVLRDSLGDQKPENDQLRYVWMLTHTRPSRNQKVAAFVPFLYSRTTNKKSSGTDPPPPIIDLKSSEKGPWSKAFRFIFKKVILNEFGVGVKSSVLQYKQNKADYRNTAIERALTVLSLYQSQSAASERLLDENELKDIQARLWLTSKSLGWHMQSENLTRVFDKELAKTRDIRNQNWELLRQYSEEQGLYFDPLEMSDGSVRHALVWTSAADIESNKDKKFDSRFLNIKNPWKDTDLANWKGYSQVRWFDENSRQVSPDTPQAKPRTLIPLALYGLDFPKIPTLLVDFRNNNNVKRREMSKRILNDITNNVLSIGQFSNLPYFLGKFSYDYITGKRGMDVNQTSRLRSYSQLKLLLTLDSELSKDVRDEIANRLENATLNPLENDVDVEAKLARDQYENLLAYAKRSDGLPKQIDKDRREEMVKLMHSGKQRFLYSAANFFSFGLYTKREKSTPELIARMDTRRQLDRHERYLREVAHNSAKPEIDSDVETLKRSLQFISDNGAAAKAKTTRALAKIFKSTEDEDMRRMCVTGLYRINNSEAKKQLLAIYGNSNITEGWRSLCAHYLKLALEEGQQISTRDARTIAAIAAN
ncbi:MAG: hypothetical protein IPL32_11075 [Chloracidobacterium sp.]|nr:hypothetical protein [Chloracidobacterium sp.]